MEYPTTNLIPFPLASQDPNPPKHIAEILAPYREQIRALQEMTPERAAEIERLKKLLGIPETAALGTLALPLLKEMVEQREKCKKCKGNSSVPCRKVVLDENWEPKAIDCPAQKDRQQYARAQRLMNSAYIPKRYRGIRAGKDFVVTAGNREAVAAAERCIDEDAGAYFFGAAGVGKTMLASVIVNERAIIGKHSFFITVPDMLEELRDYDDSARRAAKLRLLYEIPCLVIDDLGAEKATQWAGETLFRILNTRYNEELQTIITSNFTLEKVAERLPDYAGERIVRRIAACCPPVLVAR